MNNDLNADDDPNVDKDAVTVVRAGDYLLFSKWIPEGAAGFGNRGNRYMAKGDWDSAIADFSEAIRLDPGMWQLWVCRSRAYTEKREFAAAYADLAEALHLSPDNSVVYSDLGDMYEDSGDIEQAIAAHTEAIRCDPDNQIAHYNRGILYYKRGEMDACIADMKEVLRVDPDDKDARLALETTEKRRAVIRNGGEPGKTR